MATASLDRAVERIAEACLDSSKWANALATVSEATGSIGACLVPLKGRLPNGLCSEGIAEAHASYSRDGWIKRDERYRGVPILLRTGAVTDTDFASIDEINRHPYWQEWLRAHGLKWFAGVRIGFGDDIWVLSIQRSIAQGPFSPEEMRDLARLSPQLSAKGALARALGFAEIEGAAAAFEASGIAAILFDRQGKVVRLNGSAERLLDSDINVLNRNLMSYDQAATVEIEKALRAAIASPVSDEPRAVIRLPRKNKRPLIGYLLKAPRLCADAIAPCQAVMTLIDPETRTSIDEQILRDGFELTPMEARLAARLSGHLSLHHIADDMHMSYETARTHLKSIFAKLGVGRQAELSMLLSSLGRHRTGL